MTYLRVHDLLESKLVYFVADKSILDNNPHIIGVVGGEVEANLFLEDVRARYLEKESYRFTVAKEVVNGTDTTWVNADLNGPDDSNVYHVFNTLTGLHEKVVGLEAAKLRMDSIKQEFIVFCALDKIEVVDSIPAFPPKYDVNKYGQEVGVIPVEVM